MNQSLFLAALVAAAGGVAYLVWLSRRPARPASRKADSKVLSTKEAVHTSRAPLVPKQASAESVRAQSDSAPTEPAGQPQRSIELVPHNISSACTQAHCIDNPVPISSDSSSLLGQTPMGEAVPPSDTFEDDIAALLSELNDVDAIPSGASGDGVYTMEEVGPHSRHRARRRAEAGRAASSPASQREQPDCGEDMQDQPQEELLLKLEALADERRQWCERFRRRKGRRGGAGELPGETAGALLLGAEL